MQKAMGDGGAGAVLGGKAAIEEEVVAPVAVAAVEGLLPVVEIDGKKEVDDEHKITLRVPGMKSEHDFEGFIHYGNRIRLNSAQFRRLERVVYKHMPKRSLYVCTIKKSNVVKNKAKMYFSRSFTMTHIAQYVALPARIQVYYNNEKVGKVTMVMSKSVVNGKPKGGAMITSNWMDVVKQIKMRVKVAYVFWFRASGDGGLKLLVDTV